MDKLINKAKVTIHQCIKKDPSQLIELPFTCASLFFSPQHPNRCLIKNFENIIQHAKPKNVPKKSQTLSSIKNKNKSRYPQTWSSKT